jgi:hypothetical protein
MYRHILVPVEHSDAGIDALAYAVAFARSIGARITFAHLARDVQASHKGARTAAGSALDDCLLDMATVKAEVAARAQGVPCDSIRVAGAAVQHALADAADVWGCDLVCVAPPGYAAGDDAGGSNHVAGPFAAQLAAQFAASGVPVLTCAVRRSQVAARVVSALYRAHRATTGPLCGRLAAVRAAVADGTPHEHRLAQLIAEGLAHSGLAHRAPAHGGLADNELTHSGRAHDERAQRCLNALRTPRLGLGDVCWLSSVLRGRTSVVDAELGELERQHQRGAALYSELARAVEAGLAGAATSVRLEEALNEYAQFVWEYFGRKEGVIVPAAQRYLREDDWREIDAAFAAAQATMAAVSTAEHTDTTCWPDGQRH